MSACKPSKLKAGVRHDSENPELTASGRGSIMLTCAALRLQILPLPFSPLWISPHNSNNLKCHAKIILAWHFMTKMTQETCKHASYATAMMTFGDLIWPWLWTLPGALGPTDSLPVFVLEVHQTTTHCLGLETKLFPFRLWPDFDVSCELLELFLVRLKFALLRAFACHFVRLFTTTRYIHR